MLSQIPKVVWVGDMGTRAASEFCSLMPEDLQMKLEVALSLCLGILNVLHHI